MMHKYKTEFLRVKDSSFYYILGAFMTDGSIYFSLKNRGYRSYLYSNDRDWLEKINTYFSDSPLIYKNRKCYVLTISSKEIAQKFIDEGCVPNKSLVLKFPMIPSQFLPDFIRGCIDGDGSLGIYKNGKYLKPECYLCSSSKQFIAGHKAVLDIYNIDNSLITIPSATKEVFGNMILSNDHFQLKIMGKKNLQKFLSWIYYDGHLFSLKRKRDKAIEIISK